MPFCYSDNWYKSRIQIFHKIIKEKNRISKQFILRKVKRYGGVIHLEAKITKHGKKKKDKDKIENILLKHVFTGL
jgi:hypothetical protein